MYVLQIDDDVSMHDDQDVVADIIIHTATCHRNPQAFCDEFDHVTCAIAYLEEHGVRVRVSECAGRMQ